MTTPVTASWPLLVLTAPSVGPAFAAAFTSAEVSRVFIASGSEPEIITKLLAGRGPGTFFVPSGLPMEAKKRWLAYFQRPAGTIFVNECAVPVLRDQGRSLLAVGVTGVKGEFDAGDIVNIADPAQLREAILTVRANSFDGDDRLIAYGGMVFEENAHVRDGIDALYLGPDARSARDQLREALEPQLVAGAEADNVHNRQTVFSGRRIIMIAI
mgnify:CR=1 FL=1